MCVCVSLTGDLPSVRSCRQGCVCVCLKQGELQSGNNGSKVMADFCESYVSCAVICVHKHPYYTCT